MYVPLVSDSAAAPSTYPTEPGAKLQKNTQRIQFTNRNKHLFSRFYIITKQNQRRKREKKKQNITFFILLSCGGDPLFSQGNNAIIERCLALGSEAASQSPCVSLLALVSHLNRAVPMQVCVPGPCGWHIPVPIPRTEATSPCPSHSHTTQLQLSV